jgi:hypothetical protein
MLKPPRPFRLEDAAWSLALLLVLAAGCGGQSSPSRTGIASGNDVGTTGDTGPATCLDDAGTCEAYDATFATDVVDTSNQSSVAFVVTGGTSGAAFDYTISDSSGGSVSGSGTISNNPHTVEGIDLSELADGTLTLEVQLKASSGDSIAALTDTVSKDTTAPSGYATTFETAPINSTNQAIAKFTIS